MEVVISIALVVLAVGALLSLLSQSSVFSSRINKVYSASYLAQRRIDLLKRFNFDEIASEAYSEDLVRVDDDGNMSSTGDYTRSTEIDTIYGGNHHLTHVKVSVRKIRIGLDGTIEGFESNPVTMETLFTDVG